MIDVFLKTINMAISAGWIVLAVLLLRLVLRKAPKWIWVALWGIVAIRLVCPFSVESVMSLIPSAETISPEIMAEAAPTIDTGIPVLNDAVNPIIIETFSPATVEKETPLRMLLPIATSIWLVGIGIMLLYTFVSYLVLRRKICTAVLLRDRIYQCETVISPFVLGILKPKIYLPFTLADRDMEYVIAHERAHIRRLDHLWKPVGFLLLAVYWFQPLVWVGYILLCRDIELACDEKVIKGFSGGQKADYSEALLKCGVNRRMIAACPVAFGEVGVKNRIKSVLNYQKPAFWIVLLAIVASAAAAVCFLTDPVVETKRGWYIELQKDRLHNYTLTEEEKEGEITKELVITDKKSDEEVQRITFDENEWFADAPLYVDISFDGYVDIVVPYQQAASGVFYQGYVWDASAKQYVYAPALENLSNIALDTENGLILSHRTADQITNYSMYRYNADAGDFKVARNLRWELMENGLTAWVGESAYTDKGERQVIQQFSAKTTDGLFPDKADSQIAPYYSADSLWDLNGDKWKATIASQSVLFTEEANVLLQVLSSKKPFVDATGMSVYLKNYRILDSRDILAVPERFAMVDFDKDGKDEMIVYVTPKYGAYLVFHVEGDRVYGFEFNTREIVNLKADGSFMQSEGAAISTYCRLHFDGNKSTVAELAYYNGVDDQCRIGSRPYTPEEMYLYIEEFNKRTNAVWVMYGEREPDDYASLYRAFMTGETTAWHNGETRTLTSYFKSANLQREYFNYAYSDMTGDGIPELCVQNLETYIFTIQNGEVHHWYTETNAYVRPLGNGAFLYERHGGAPTNIRYEYYELDANAKQTLRVTFSWWDGATVEKGKVYPDVYMLNGEEVTKEVYEEKTAKYLDRAKDTLVWADINFELERIA